MTSQVYEMGREIFIKVAARELAPDETATWEELAACCFESAQCFYARRQTVEKAEFMEGNNDDSGNH